MSTPARSANGDSRTIQEVANGEEVYRQEDVTAEYLKNRVENVLHFVEEQRVNAEGRGFEYSEDIDGIADNLRMAALSARMSVSAVRLLCSKDSLRRAASRRPYRRSPRTSETGVILDAVAVPAHVVQLGHYLHMATVDDRPSSDEAHRADSKSSQLGNGDVSAVSSRASMHFMDTVAACSTVAEDTLPEGTPYAWVEGFWFKQALIATIFSNMIVLAIETDDGSWPYWDAVNAAFLLLFVVELGIRIRVRGFAALFWVNRSSMWMIYAALVVAVGIADLGVALCAGLSADGSGRGTHESAANLGGPQAPGLSLVAPISDSAVDHGQGQWTRLPPLPFNRVSPARAMMLTRLLRLVRLIQLEVRLYDFVRFLKTTFTTFAWILSIILLVCLVLSVVLTRLVGHGFAVPTSTEGSDEMRELFVDVPTSLFNLFRLTTIDNWSAMADPMVEVNVCWRFFFVVFITFMSWTMLSLLTAVASENLISGTQGKKGEETLLRELGRQDFITFLCMAFVQADADTNGLLSKAEFISLMSAPEVIEQIEQQGITFNNRDLEMTWEVLDVNEAGDLTIDELIDGLNCMVQELATKQVASVERDLKRLGRNVDQDAKETARSCQAVLENQVDTARLIDTRNRDRQYFSKLADRLSGRVHVEDPRMEACALATSTVATGSFAVFARARGSAISTSIRLSSPLRGHTTRGKTIAGGGGQGGGGVGSASAVR